MSKAKNFITFETTERTTVHWWVDLTPAEAKRLDLMTADEQTAWLDGSQGDWAYTGQGDSETIELSSNPVLHREVDS